MSVCVCGAKMETWGEAPRPKFYKTAFNMQSDREPWPEMPLTRSPVADEVALKRLSEPHCDSAVHLCDVTPATKVSDVQSAFDYTKARFPCAGMRRVGLVVCVPEAHCNSPVPFRNWQLYVTGKCVALDLTPDTWRLATAAADDADAAGPLPSLWLLNTHMYTPCNTFVGGRVVYG